MSNEHRVKCLVLAVMQISAYARPVDYNISGIPGGLCSPESTCVYRSVSKHIIISQHFLPGYKGKCEWIVEVGDSVSIVGVANENLV